MRFGTHQKIWMCFRRLDLMSWNGRTVSSACGQNSKFECRRSQVLPRMPFAVDEFLVPEYGVRQAQSERSIREIEDYWLLSVPLGCELFLNIRNSKSAYPVVPWPAGQAGNAGQVDWSGSAAGALMVMKSWDQVRGQMPPSFVPMFQRMATEYSLKNDFLDSSMPMLQRPSCQTDSNSPVADIYTSLDPFLKSADYFVQMPALKDAGIPMETSSVKRKRKKKMNKHKQRKLRRRDRHRK